MLISSSRQMPPIDVMRNARQFAPRVKQTLINCHLTARQRDGQGAYPLQNTGPRPSLTKHDIGRILASNVYDPAQPVQGIQLLLVSVAVS
jgi:hypothetical protein